MDLTKEEKLALLGKYAVLREEILRPDFREMKHRIIKIGAGSFNPEMWVEKENVCTISADGHCQCWNWVDIERLAAEEEVEWVKPLFKKYLKKDID